MATTIPTSCKQELRARAEALRRRNPYLYEALFALGGLWQSRDMLHKLGNAKFGPPTPVQEKKLTSIVDLERLRRLAVRLLKVDSWDALLRGR